MGWDVLLQSHMSYFDLASVGIRLDGEGHEVEEEFVMTFATVVEMIVGGASYLHLLSTWCLNGERTLI
jgi:hypothetical protein